MLHRETRCSVPLEGERKDQRKLLSPSKAEVEDFHDVLGNLCTLHVQATPHRIFQDFVDERQWKVLVNSPEEHQSDQATRSGTGRGEC